MSEWDILDTELDRWARADGVVTLWWRDDDAKEPTPALSRLLRLSAAYAVPLGLAVVPLKADEALLDGLTAGSNTMVLQHGFAHANHAPRGEKKAEFGAHRPLSVMGEEISAGAGRLREAFRERYLPLFVPPWNRLSQSLLPILPTLGFVGLSTFSPRTSASPEPGLRQVNTHVDLIDWRGGRGFKGTARIAAEIAAHLYARRSAHLDPYEPSGVLSHHLDHDEGCWRFLEQLFARTARRENVRWLTPAEALDS